MKYTKDSQTGTGVLEFAQWAKTDNKVTESSLFRTKITAAVYKEKLMGLVPVFFKSYHCLFFISCKQPLRHETLLFPHMCSDIKNSQVKLQRV